MNEMNEAKNINKPITMVINETKKKFVNACNESGLSPALLDLIVGGFYSEVHSLAERQASEEEAAYVKAVEEINKETISKDNNIN